MSYYTVHMLQMHNQSRRTCSLFSSIINIHTIGTQVQRLYVYMTTSGTLSFHESYVRMRIRILYYYYVMRLPFVVSRRLYICPSDTCIQVRCTHNKNVTQNIQIQVVGRYLSILRYIVYKILIYVYIILADQRSSRKAQVLWIPYTYIRRVGINVTFR